MWARPRRALLVVSEPGLISPAMKFARHLGDPKTPASVRTSLNAAVAETPSPGGLPPLCASLKHDFADRGAGCEVLKMRPGERVRAVDAGGFGHVGITLLFDESKSDQARAAICS